MSTIEQAIGQEIRRIRTAAGVGQSALAAAARQYGLVWTRATIAAIELGRKQLSLGELALIPLVLAEADITGGRILDLSDLIPPIAVRDVDVGPGLQLPLNIARMLLLGDDDARASIAPFASAKPTLLSLDPRVLEAADDAEQKAALVLQVSPGTVVQAAHRRWGRSLTAERDRRVDVYTRPMLTRDPDEASRAEWPRRLQAIRGHVTRELLEELRPLLKKDVKRKKRKGGPR